MSSSEGIESRNGYVDKLNLNCQHETHYVSNKFSFIPVQFSGKVGIPLIIDLRDSRQQYFRSVDYAKLKIKKKLTFSLRLAIIAIQCLFDELKIHYSKVPTKTYLLMIIIRVPRRVETFKLQTTRKLLLFAHESVFDTVVVSPTDLLTFKHPSTLIKLTPGCSCSSSLSSSSSVVLSASLEGASSVVVVVLSSLENLPAWISDVAFRLSMCTTNTVNAT